MRSGLSALLERGLSLDLVYKWASYWVHLTRLILDTNMISSKKVDHEVILLMFRCEVTSRLNDLILYIKNNNGCTLLPPEDGAWNQ